MMSFGLAPLMPAGLTLGQTSTHLPHFVQASSMWFDAVAESRLEGDVVHPLPIQRFGPMRVDYPCMGRMLILRG